MKKIESNKINYKAIAERFKKILEDKEFWEDYANRSTIRSINLKPHDQQDEKRIKKLEKAVDSIMIKVPLELESWDKGGR